MTTTEIWIGAPFSRQKDLLDQGYTLAPHQGHWRNRYVMAHRPANGSVASWASVCERTIGLGCQLFGVNRAVLMGQSKRPKLWRARWAMWWVAYQNGLGTSAIGRAFNRDHSSITHGVKRAEEFLEKDPAFREMCDHLLALVGEKANGK